MPYQTESFFFLIPARSFINCEIKQPFFAEIEYSYQRERMIEVLNIKMSIKALGHLPLNQHLTEEITEAARQHHQKHFADPDDISTALSGMPQGKNKRL